MNLVCSECGLPVNIYSVQQFGSDITIKIDACPCYQRDGDKLEELKEENTLLNKHLISIKDDVITLLDRYGANIESEGETNENRK